MNTFWPLAAILCLTLAMASASPAAPSPEEESPEAFAKRTQWWREARFGMFIHWGVYAVPADATDINGNRAGAEWYQYNKRMQVSDYEKFAPRFNPTRFDAKAWVKAAKDAGMKYIVITSKHHDGFAMYDSKVSDYNIVKGTPFGRDPLKELAGECRKQGIRLCFYHSIMDWHHPDYLPRREWEKETRPAGDASLDRYLDYMKSQIREILTGYGPIGILWFDGQWEHSAEELRAAEVTAFIRGLQPGILINDRIQRPEDYATPEQYIPGSAMGQGRLWETCMTMNDTWGYARNDHNWKSTNQLIRNLCDIASKGGNFLLNVGPTETGEFTPETVERLAGIGRWMEANGEAVYGTERSPFRRLSFDGRVTSKGNTLYLHVFNWPEGGIELTGLKTPVRSAKALDGGQRLKVTIGPDGPGIARPARLDPVATVVEVRLAGAPVIEETPIAAAGDGTFTLSAFDATLDGSRVAVETIGGIPSLGYWTDAKDTAAWKLDVAKAGPHRVTLEYACTPESAGSTFRVEAGGSSVTGTVDGTGSWQEFRTMTLDGTLDLPAGRAEVRIVPETMPRGAVMNLRSVVLAPVG